jgi:protein-glutamine gamma-glutamyltransferase
MATAAALPAKHEPLPAIQRYFEVSLFLLVGTGIFSIVATNKLDHLSDIVASAAVLYKGLRIWRGRPAELSHRTATALVLAYFLFFPVDLWIFSRNLATGSPNPMLYAGLLAAIHLLLFATLVRLYSSRTTRDFIFLALLAFAAVLAAAILTVNTSFLVALAMFLLLSVSSFVGLEIRRSSEGAAQPLVDPGSPAARRLHRALWLTSLVVAGGALLLGGMIFFLIPRFTAGYLSALNLQPTLMTGFTDDVALGEIGRIQQSHTVVMRIQVQGDAARAEDVHWRGAVLTNFDGKRWYSTEHDSEVVTPDAAGAYNLGVQPMPPGTFYLLKYTVMMEPLATDTIFLAAHPAAVWGRFGTGGSRLAHMASREYLVFSRNGTLQNPQHNSMAMHYNAVSEIPQVPPAKLREASTDYPDNIRNMYLQLPLLDPRIADLARQVTEHAPTPYDKAANIELFLRSKFQYTLDLSDMRQEDPLSYFLFVKRAGNCEYFAAAMTVMLRTLNVPARYVTGFETGEYNDLANDYIVRASDAHSWVEVYFPNYGWITFDPTPPGDSNPTGFFARLGLYWDWFQFNWNEWVINYDFAHQLALAHGVQDSSRRWTDVVQDYYQSRRRAMIDDMKLLQLKLANSPYSLPGALVFLVLLLLYFRGRAMGGFLAVRWSLRAHQQGELPPHLVAFEYRQMLRMLERRGWRKSPAQTPREFVASIPVAEFAGPAGELTELYQSARFGAHPADANRVISLLRKIKEMRRVRKGASKQSPRLS